MHDTDLYKKILGINKPWVITQVTIDDATLTIEVVVEIRGEPCCPRCRKACAGYDSRQRKWRHLDSCQYKTLLVADMPRVECAEHGVMQIDAPWADRGSHFTALFECVVIDWLREANQSAVGRQLQLSWHEVDGIMSRAVARGLARREKISPTRIGVDETSFQKRHEYVTVVTNIDNSRVIAVMDGRTEESLSSYLGSLDQAQRTAIAVAAMDMWPAYINAVKQHLPNAKIAFDRFHIAKHLGDAVNAVRKDEHRELLSQGDATLAKTKYVWLQKPSRMKRSRRMLLSQLIYSTLRTARAWALKETASKLWHYISEAWARRAWNEWIGWAMNCKPEPMISAAKMVQKHLDGIINAIVLKTTNALGESMNAKIQKIKSQACGYRNRQRFRDAIMFHLGGLDMYPQKSLAHTKP